MAAADAKATKIQKSTGSGWPIGGREPAPLGRCAPASWRCFEFLVASVDDRLADSPMLRHQAPMPPKRCRRCEDERCPVRSQQDLACRCQEQRSVIVIGGRAACRRRMASSCCSTTMSNLSSRLTVSRGPAAHSAVGTPRSRARRTLSLPGSART